MQFQLQKEPKFKLTSVRPVQTCPVCSGLYEAPGWQHFKSHPEWLKAFRTCWPAKL